MGAASAHFAPPFGAAFAPPMLPFSPPPAPEEGITTLFVGGLNPNDIRFHEAAVASALFEKFSVCGPISHIKLMRPEKACALVTMQTRSSAEHALESLNGILVGPSRIRLEWKKPSAGPGGMSTFGRSGPPHAFHGMHHGHFGPAPMRYEPDELPPGEARELWYPMQAAFQQEQQHFAAYATRPPPAAAPAASETRFDCDGTWAAAFPAPTAARSAAERPLWLPGHSVTRTDGEGAIDLLPSHVLGPACGHATVRALRGALKHTYAAASADSGDARISTIRGMAASANKAFGTTHTAVATACFMAAVPAPPPADSFAHPLECTAVAAPPGEGK